MENNDLPVDVNELGTCDAKKVGIDEAIDMSGSFGRYQFLVNVLMNAVYLALNVHAYILYFVASDPPWTCVNKASSLFCKQHFGKRIPESSDLFEERCKLNRSDWIFTKDKTYSIVTEYDLVCDYAWMGSLANAALFIGWGLSGPFVGYFSDTYGRRKTSVASVLLGALSLVGLPFINHIWQFTLLRILLGAGVGCFTACTFTICTEIVGTKYRAATGTFFILTNLIGGYILILLAYFIPHWRKLILYISSPVLVAVVISWFIPETLRWIYASGKKAEAMEKLRKIAKFNKKNIEYICLANPKAETDVESKRYSYVDILFRHCSVIVVVVSLCFGWAVAALLYYGLTWESSDLGGNMYLNFAFSFLVELPSPVLYVYSCDKIGRKSSFLLFATVVSVMACAVSALYFVSESMRGLNTARLVLAMIGKLSASLSFSALYLWTFELFPTVVRSQGLILCQIAGRFGSVAAPFIATNLAATSKALPFILMSILGFLSVLFGCILPETNKKASRENFEDFFVNSLKTVNVQEDDTNKQNDQAPLLFTSES